MTYLKHSIEYLYTQVYIHAKANSFNHRRYSANFFIILCIFLSPLTILFYALLSITNIIQSKNIIIVSSFIYVYIITFVINKIFDTYRVIKIIKNREHIKVDFFKYYSMIFIMFIILFLINGFFLWLLTSH